MTGLEWKNSPVGGTDAVGKKLGGAGVVVVVVVGRWRGTGVVEVVVW